MQLLSRLLCALCEKPASLVLPLELQRWSRKSCGKPFGGFALSCLRTCPKLSNFFPATLQNPRGTQTSHENLLPGNKIRSKRKQATPSHPLAWNLTEGTLWVPRVQSFATARTSQHDYNGRASYSTAQCGAHSAAWPSRQIDPPYGCRATRAANLGVINALWLLGP